MDVYTWPIGSVISKLLVLIKKESVLLTEVKDCLLSLTRGLSQLEYWFRSWSNTPPDQLDEDERFWLSQLREALYDANSIIDYLAVNPSDSPDFIAYVKQITERAKEVLTRLRLPIRDLHVYEQQPELVNIGGQKDVLIKILSEEDDPSKKPLKILFVVGVGGSGKTALARVVYDQLKPQFDCGAFVTVPLQHSMEGFFTEMLRQLDMENLTKNGEANDETQLISQIQFFLQNKRYLIIIDGLRNQEHWPRISCCLPDNDCGSRIIATTRFSDVARSHLFPQKSIYEIQHLGFVDTKILASRRYFRGEVSCRTVPLDGFDGFFKMFGGTPSAIISIALLLSTKVTTTKAWLELKNFLNSACKQAEGTMQVNVSGFELMRCIIFLTYVHLPGTLKDCFLYLAVHGKNRRIHRTTMVRKWIAEGFIHEYVGCSREEVASRYIDELINMNFMQLVEDDDCIGKEIYEVNYMVLYVLRLISHQENFSTFLSEVDVSGQYADSVRLCIQYSGSELSVHTEKMDPFRIRSITIVGPAKVYLSNYLVYLRLLDLDGCKDLDNSAMYHICRMIMLKYLSLKNTKVTKIPPKIGELRCLETMVIRQTQVSCLPPEIGLLQNLETLDIRQTLVSSLPPEIKLLQNLETLDIRQTQVSCLPPEIGLLRNLETLDISQTQVSCLPSEIGSLQNLETLDISHTPVSCLPREIGLLRNLGTLDIKQTQVSFLPPEIGSLQNLETLVVRQTKVRCLPPEIGSLRNLETLDIRQTQVKELSKELFELPKLAYLYYGQSSSLRGVKLAMGSHEWKSVKVLDTVDSREWTGRAMWEITVLIGVRELEIVLHDQPDDKDQNEKLLSSIAKCDNLQTLIIYGDYNPSDDFISVPPYFPLLEEVKMEGRFVQVPRWLARLSTLKKLDVRVCKLEQDDLKILGGLRGLSTLALALVCIPRKKEVTIPTRLHSSTCIDLPPSEETCHAGFASLQIFSFDCRVPWITFQEGAMPRLKQLHLKLYGCPADKFPSGLNNLNSLEKIILQYASVYASSSGVTKVVAAMREEASSHCNLIRLSVNGYHEVLLPNTMVDETLTGTEIEEASNHGVLLSNAKADETIAGTEIEETSNHVNQIELSVIGDHELLLSNTKLHETITCTEIKECY